MLWKDGQQKNTQVFKKMDVYQLNVLIFFRPPTPTEFDFDEEQMQSTPKNSFLSRRRTPGEINKSIAKTKKQNKVI